MTEQEKQFENDFVQVKIEKQPNCSVQLSTHALEPLLKKAQKNAIKEVKKEVSLPGFRKGKAPEDLILKKNSASIDQKTRKILADLAFEESLKLTKLSVLNNSSRVMFDMDHFSEKEASLKFTFEIEPAIPKVDPKKFTLKEPKRAEVEKKQIDEAIHQMMLFYAKWTPITERGVNEGDYIIIDLDTLEEPSQKVFSDTRFLVTEGHMALWMKKLVLDQKIGSVLEGISEPDPNASEEEKKTFTPKKVQLTLKKIETAELPELNAEFLQKVGAKDKEQIQTYFKDLLNQKADEKVDTDKREQVNRFLLDEYSFEMPLSLIETEKKHRKKELSKDLRYKEALEKMSQEEKEIAEKKVSIQSEDAVRLFYISRAVIRDQNISVSQDEVQQEAYQTLNAMGPVNIDPQKIPNDVFALALSKLVLAKTQNFILEPSASPTQGPVIEP